jgi:transcriptional regulator with XRE-family HTH domain
VLYRAYIECSRTLAHPCNNVAMPYIDDAAKAWQLELAKRVGGAVKDRRASLKMTAQQLAERTKELGYPVTRVAISKIESNSRAGKFDVAELAVLAAALNTSPVALLFPGPYDKEIQALPGKAATEFDAVQWFSGLSHGFTDTTDGRESAQLRAEYRENTQLLNRWRQMEEWQDRKASIVIPKGGKLTDEQRDQIAFYDSQIEQFRVALGIRDDDDA